MLMRVNAKSLMEPKKKKKKRKKGATRFSKGKSWQSKT